MTPHTSHLPDPQLQPEFYADVPLKRLIAWLMDTVLVLLVSLLIVPFTAFTALFFFPVLFSVVGFFYRWVTLSTRSATWGMRLASVELRRADGQRFDAGTAAMHTLLFTVFSGFVLPQIASAALMLMGPRAQGLHDLMLGTAAVNRAAIH